MEKRLRTDDEHHGWKSQANVTISAYDAAEQRRLMSVLNAKLDELLESNMSLEMARKATATFDIRVEANFEPSFQSFDLRNSSLADVKENILNEIKLTMDAIAITLPELASKLAVQENVIEFQKLGYGLKETPEPLEPLLSIDYGYRISLYERAYGASPNALLIGSSVQKLQLIPTSSATSYEVFIALFRLECCLIFSKHALEASDAHVHVFLKSKEKAAVSLDEVLSHQFASCVPNLRSVFSRGQMVLL